ncbi:unnamed protein product [Alopecurus aequalis]
MEAYKLWVLKNRELVRSLESLANWATWILPERFGNSEVAPEAVYALVGIVECVNQHIVETPINESVPWALVVSILKDAEAVVEVAAQRFAGDDRKWDFLAVTEAAKACVRFAAFRESGYSRMLLHGGEVENDEAATPMNGHPQNEIACNGKAALSKNGNLQPTPTVTMEVERPSIWCWKGVSGRLFMLGEAVHIFRPLVYVLLMTKFGSRSSWTPWLVSLALEVTSLGIHSRKVHLLSSAERDELNRRKMMMWVIYAVRDPFFGKYTRPQLEKAQKALNSVPLIGLGKLVDLSEGVQSRYTYTSGS